MKMNNSFWKFYLPLLFIVCALVLGLLINNKKKMENSDAYKFNQEYSALNGKLNDNGDKYPIVSISNSNQYIYASMDDIKNLLDGNDTGVIYFGYPESINSRKVVAILNDVAKSNNINKIYYYNIKDITSIIKLNSNNTLNKINGTDFYYYLLTKLDSYLSEYYIKDDYGKKIDALEKVLNVPTVVFIKNGQVVGIHEGTVSSQTDDFQELSDDQKQELKNIYNNYFILIK